MSKDRLGRVAGKNLRRREHDEGDDPQGYDADR
jgi:hypothetical protein